MNEEDRERQALVLEDSVRDKVDSNGTKWTKVYFGGGPHFRNWHDQVLELRGEENVEVEEVKVIGLKCFQDGDEKMYRIWVKEMNSPIELT